MAMKTIIDPVLLRDSYERTHSIYAVAQEFGCSTWTSSKLLRELGIELRGRVNTGDDLKRLREGHRRARKAGMGSDKRHWNWQGGDVTRECTSCGKVYQTSRGSARKYCSLQCGFDTSSRDKRGARAPGYVDGRSRLPENLYGAVRSLRRYRLWKEEVVERDGHACVDCGTKHGLDVHHVVQFVKMLSDLGITTTEQAEHCEDLWRPSCGVTVCKSCHKARNMAQGRVSRHMKLSKDQVRQIRALRNYGDCQPVDLARVFGISKHHVWQIASGLRRRDVGMYEYDTR